MYMSLLDKASAVWEKSVDNFYKVFDSVWKEPIKYLQKPSKFMTFICLSGI